MKIVDLRRALALATVSALLYGGIGSAQTGHASEVTIYRDAKGVPHVFAEDSAAVMFGLGYSLAHDRLAQLELSRRGALGQRAELLGRSAIASDIIARDRALPRQELLRMYAAIPKEHQRMMQGLVDGINKRIEEIARDPQHDTPYEFVQWGIRPQPWTLLDFLSVVAATPHDREGYELQNLAFLQAMVARYGEKVGRTIFDDVVPLSDPDSPTTIPAGEDLAPAQPMPQPHPYPLPIHTATVAARDATVPRTEASRCLVIGPTRSASGHVLMLEATADGPESHLHGGGFDTAGFSTPGWGPPIMGRSLDHGWLLTSGNADTTTTYAEQLNPADRYRYRFKGAWLRMETRKEVIQVKGAAPVTHEVARTVHGPIVSWDVAHRAAYSERYAVRGKELDNWVAIVELARARNLQEFQDKGVSQLVWNLGVCYGNAAGQFGFWEAGLIPKRSPKADSRLPTPGTGEYEWDGFLSFDERPHMLNPKQGFIHTWNSKATSWSPEGDDARIGKAFRTYLGTELAAAGHALTLLDMREINRKIFNGLGARDHTNTTPAFFASYIRAAVATTQDAEVKRAADLMLSFNGLYEDLDRDGKYDNPGLTIFRAWLQIAPQMIFGPSIGEWWWKIDEDRYHKYQTSLLLRAVQGDAAGLPLRYDYFAGRGREALLVATLRKTVDTLKAQFTGKDMSQWRLPIFWKYYDPARQTPDRPALPGGESVSTRAFAVLGLGPAVVRHNGGEGWVGLMEIDPNQPVLYSVVEAGGQNLFIDPSGKGNPNLSDQVQMHTENELKRIDMLPETVKSTAVAIQHLTY